jgi:preprotein translocase subunit YajC
MTPDNLPTLWSALAWAQSATGGPSAPTEPAGPAPPGGFFSSQLILIFIIFALFYVLLIMPQQRQRKKHQAMLDAIKKGDRVVTTGGVLGSVTNIHEGVLTLQVAENVKIKVLRSAVASLRGDDDGAGS